MKKIDRLLEVANEASRCVSMSLFPGDDDGFLEALGVDPVKYEKKHSDGNVGYDIMAALNSVAAEVWKD